MDYSCVQMASSAKEFLQQTSSPAIPPRLVLYNQRSFDQSIVTFRKELRARWPRVIILPFEIFDSSDEAFMSMTGNDRG